ncbi:MAG TPA: hypothetical protein VLB50_04390, partial [Ignavibacteriaceae bacterium]|nr:hypothetical protein [Ignavibacteriaceae bacterium]
MKPFYDFNDEFILYINRIVNLVAKVALAVVFLFILVNAQNGESVYFRNFVHHSGGALCTHQPPITSFTAYLNNDQSLILIENAPRWDAGGVPNINGQGSFGVELGNFTNPSLQVGDKVFIRFTCNQTTQQGTIEDSVTSIPWARFPLDLYLSGVNIPQPPQNISLTSDSSTGYRTISWDLVSGMTYTVYRRNFNETLPDGRQRMLYHLIAADINSNSYIDQTALLSEHYGYIVYAKSSSGIMSSHSIDVNEGAPSGYDLTIGYITRLPHIDYVWGSPNPDIDGWPAAGDNVTWEAKVKNWTNQNLNVQYQWMLDSVIVDTGTVYIPSDSIVGIDYPWIWTFTRHKLEIDIDPNNLINEEEEGNNSLMIYTNAITAGFYVEQTLYNYFHQYQKELGVHSNCWEDWANRHVKRWNQMLQSAIFPESPDGVIDRVRIDEIVVVPDSALPLAGGLPSNTPNLNDRTVDLQWGFTTAILQGSFYSNHTSISDDNAFYFEGSLFHELGHARYLIDVYGFDVNDDGTGNTVGIMENGNLIVGTPFMPFTGSAVYSTPIHGLMNGQYTYIDHYSAPALNLIVGDRATYGNYNAPDNIGVFMQNLPQNNIITFKDNNGNTLPGADVKIYQAGPHSGEWYGKYFDNTPDLQFTADSLGKVNAGRCPFSANGTIVHDYGYSNSIAIVRVQ